jgi:hypothetical protein
VISGGDVKPSIIVSIMATAILCGCAAQTVKEVRSNPAAELHMTVDQNYQRVYKQLLEKMQECYKEGTVGAFAQMHIRTSLYNELREANISYMMTNLGSQNHYLQVDIKGMGESTNLDAYVFFKTWSNRIPQIREWAINSDASCDVN